jgi:glucose dehydrogenase
MEQIADLSSKLEKDQKYKDSGKAYIDAPFDSPPYDRIESTIMKAFMDMPELKVPGHPTPPSERIYEFRSYESATEKLHVKKVHMFNQGGELKLFEKLDFNAIFYGEVISGSTMPNLIYMTSFPSKAVRDEYWGIFRVDPEWEVMKELEEYRNTVSKNITLFLYPTDYSDI